MEFSPENFGYTPEGKKIDYASLYREKTKADSRNMLAEMKSIVNTSAIFQGWEAINPDKKAEEALTHYSEDQILQIDLYLEVLEFLPESILLETFKTTRLDKRQVAGQLANGILEKSGNSFLLKPDFPDALNENKDKYTSKLAKLKETLKSEQSSQQFLTDKFSEMLENETDEKTTVNFLEEIKSLNTKSAQTSTEIFNTSDIINRLNLAFTRGQIKFLRQTDNEETADKLMLSSYEKSSYLFDNNEKSLLQYKESFDRLNKNNKLSDFEKNLHLKNSKNALNLAVNKNLELGFGIDVLDQAKLAAEKPENYKFTLSSYIPPLSEEEHAAKQRIILSAKAFKGSLRAPRHEPGNILSSNSPGYEGKELGIYPHGSFPEFPIDLENITLPSGKNYQGISISSEAKKLLNKKPPDGMILILLRQPKGIKLSRPFLELNRDEMDLANPRNEVRIVEEYDILDTKDFAYAKVDNDRLVVKNTNEEDFRNYDVSKLENVASQSTTDLLKILDLNNDITTFSQSAGKISGNINNIIKFFTATAENSKPEQLINFLRVQSKEVLDCLGDESIKPSLVVAKELLSKLKYIETGAVDSKLEQELNQRIKTLEYFIGLFENKELQNVLETILDKSKFHSGTVLNWFKYNGLKVLSGVALGALAIVSITATLGTATPFWIMTAAATTAGTIGYELGAEGQYYLHQNFDEDVKAGRATYGDRSIMGSWLHGDEIYDPETKQHIKMDFAKDVFNPYVKGFMISFVSGMAMVGLGEIAGKFLSLSSLNSSVTQLTLKQIEKIKGHLTKLKGIPKVEINSVFAKSLIDQLKTDMIQEGSTTSIDYGLSQIEEHLGFLARFFAVTIQGFKPIKPGAGQHIGEFTYDKNMKIVINDLKLNGCTVENATNGKIEVTTFDGTTFNLIPSV